jgi:hypothetical protein
MYCPICFNDTLKIRSSGVIKLTFDGLAKNTSQYTYNLKTDDSKRLKFKLKEKIEEFCKWYGDFQNKSPIKRLQLFSADFQCSNNCSLSLDNRMTVVGPIYYAEDVVRILKEQGKKYKIHVEVTEESF